MNDIEKLFEEGRKAVEEGHYKIARQKLQQVLKQDRNHLKAWLYYARCVQPKKRQKYINRALKIDPYNSVALKMQRQLNQSKKTNYLAVEEHEYGAELMKIHMSWQYRFLILLLCVVALGVSIYFGTTPHFIEFLELIIRERSIFVETIFHDTYDFLELISVFILGLIFLLTIIMTIGQKITIYEHGIEKYVFFRTTKMHWAEVTRAQDIYEISTLRIFGFNLNSESYYTIALTTGRKIIQFGINFQNNHKAGRLIESLLAPYIPVERVNRFDIQTPLQKFVSAIRRE